MLVPLAGSGLRRIPAGSTLQVTAQQPYTRSGQQESRHADREHENSVHRVLLSILTVARVANPRYLAVAQVDNPRNLVVVRVANPRNLVVVRVANPHYK